MARFLLGDLQMDGFEVPATLHFGGAQRAAVHKLLGGGRVIDAMGRDDCAISWHGVLAGPAASERARSLDAKRAAGLPLPLSWEAFSYQIVITSLSLEFQSPWWITYEISCTVLADLSQPLESYINSAANTVLADLNSANAWVGLSGVLTEAGATAALDPGSAAIPGILAGVRAASAEVSSGLSGAEAILDSSDIGALVSASGTIAQFAVAQGYLQRSIENLQGII